jgi:enolase-phosphatase E1
MAYSDPENQITTILLDIEGTTTPIDFVYKTLFPYARAHLGEFILSDLSTGQLSGDLMGLIQEHAADLTAGQRPPPIPRDPQDHPQSLVHYLQWLMDQDRKSTPLKSIQGKIWEAGYNTGELKSEVFPDVPPAFERWALQGREISIYSSGSVLAQKLLFANTHAGDLTSFISAYFDTNIGPKRVVTSYRRIAAELRRQPAEILFLSDTAAELAAAKQAGFAAVLCSRPDNQPPPAAQEYCVVDTFDDIFPT